MLKRKIENILLEWKNRDDKKPLIVKGARQVGKTESIRLFAKQNYANYVEINFALQMENFVDSVRWQLQKVSAEKEKFSADILRLLGGVRLWQ